MAAPWKDSAVLLHGKNLWFSPFFSTMDLSKTRNPCECCQGKIKFIRKINGNYMHNMVIPSWFLDYFGGKIPGTLKLEAHNGITYDVGVTKNMNRTILKSGWAAFLDANQIEENYSLMFRYLGNARFEVTIFDSNGKEKALCCAEMKAASDAQTPNNRYADNSTSSHDGTTQSSSAEGSDPDGCPKEASYRYFKSANTPALSYTSDPFSEDNPSADESLELDDLQMLPKECVLSGRCVLTVAQKANIRALVAEVQPRIQVLVVLIKKTNVEPFTVLVIRKDYALACFPRESQTITLQIPKKSKGWQCNLCIRRDGGCNLRLGNFVRDNNVREGDVCIFQPMTKVKAKRFTVMVHLLHKASIGCSPGERIDIASNHKRTSTMMASTARVKQDPATDGEEIPSAGYEDHGPSDNSEEASEPPFILPDGTRLTQAQETKVLEKVGAMQSELPIYVAVMNKTSVHLHLVICKRYVSRYLTKRYATGHHGKRSVISLVLQREGKSRTWDTELRHTSDRTMICKGWVSFVRANDLRENDICLFKLMENEEPQKMMVYIIRREKC
ncbi:unnamed protein product [Alopecurus aequalis]